MNRNLRTLLGATALSGLLVGCTGRAARLEGDAPAASAIPAVVSARSIVERCADRFAEAKSLLCRGTCRAGRRAIASQPELSCAIERRGSLRVELPSDTLVVIGRNVWHRTASDGRIGRSQADAVAPLSDALRLIEDEGELLPLHLFLRGRRALDLEGGGAWGWTMEENAYSGRRPCFVVARQATDRRGVLRLWIDQDTFALRRWSVGEPGRSDGRAVVDVELSAVALDQPIDGRMYRIVDPGLALERGR